MFCKYFVLVNSVNKYKKKIPGNGITFFCPAFFLPAYVVSKGLHDA